MNLKPEIVIFAYLDLRDDDIKSMLGREGGILPAGTRVYLQEQNPETMMWRNTNMVEHTKPWRLAILSGFAEVGYIFPDARG